MLKNCGVWFSFLLVASSGCATTDLPPGGEGVTADPIENIVLERGGAFAGFCPNENQFVDATFTRNEANELVLGGTMFRAYDRTEACPDDYCLVTEEIAPFAISPADATRLGELAEELRLTLDQETFLSGSCVGERDPGCDPCVVSELVIDGVSHMDNPCQESPCNRYARKLGELQAFIDGLAPPSR